MKFSINMSDTLGQSVARAIDWIISDTGVTTSHFHLVGFSLGAHMIGVAGRNVRSGLLPYLTGEDCSVK